jgi:hypothetical protein
MGDQGSHVTERGEGGSEEGPGLNGEEVSAALSSSADAAAASLAREVYWAGDGGTRFAADAGSLGDQLGSFAHALRVEQRQLLPAGETLLGSNAGWKRVIKSFVWRLTRFSTMRYDRLLADLAEMNAELAHRVAEVQEEIAQIRGDRDDGAGAPR